MAAERSTASSQTAQCTGDLAPATVALLVRCPSVAHQSEPAEHVLAVIDLLLTIGYIDGLLHEGEQTFIRAYMDRLVERFGGTEETQAEWRARIDSAFEQLASEVAALAAEVVAAGDESYMRTRLKVRAVALFRAFVPADQKVALELLREIMRADGEVTKQEMELYDELVVLFTAAPTLPLPATLPRAPSAHMLRIEAQQTLEVSTFAHPLLDPIERPYSQDPATLHAQLASDYHLIFQAINVWERQRARGNGRLAGITSVGQLSPGTRFLDGHVYMLRPGAQTELIVLGDLHGSYACLKAALLQSRFIERALRHQQDPANNPDVKLVLLGDYIDRGTFGFEGVLRAALHLLVLLPDHVVMLRGNHELFTRAGDRIASAVTPAEALPLLAERAPVELLEAYRHLFDHMPTSMLCERTLFVHGGVPRDDTLAGRFRDLSALDDAVVRFEMMWSDPVQTDHVPVELQRANPRFSFGRDQFRAFMQRVGCDTMVRGHEVLTNGFKTMFDIGDHKLHSLFSVGGRDNLDLPADSRYRNVRPMALTIQTRSGTPTAVPWAIDYKHFTSATHNGLYRP